jgi:hypothetical protein
MEKTSTASPNPHLLSRAAQYVRMSTEHEQYSQYSLENQLEVIRQYGASHGMEIVQAYSAHGRSGLNIAGREGLNRLMSDVENQTGQFLLCSSTTSAGGDASRMSMRAPTTNTSSRGQASASTIARSHSRMTAACRLPCSRR